MTRTIKFDQATEDRRRQWLASFKLPDEPGVEMRLLAYASQPVLDAARAAGVANAEAEQAFTTWKTLIDETQHSAPDAPVREQDITVRQALQAALDVATSSDEALLDAVRADLHSRPSRGRALAYDSTS